MGYPTRLHKLISALAKRQVVKGERIKIGTLVTDPVLKLVPGPDATRPLAEGEDESSYPGSVLQWFVDIRLDADRYYIKDAIIPVQAKAAIGQKGSPVTVWAEPTTGAWMVVGRADRKNDVQSFSTYTLEDLGLAFTKGLVEDPSRPGVLVSPFYFLTNDPASEGSSQGGLNRREGSGTSTGVTGTGSGSADSYTVGTVQRLIGLGDLRLGVDALGSYYEITTYPNGVVETERINP